MWLPVDIFTKAYGDTPATLIVCGASHLEAWLGYAVAAGEEVSVLFYTPGDFGPDRVVALAAVGTVTECVIVQPASNDRDDPDRLPGYFATIRVAYWHADLPGPDVLAA